MGYNGTITLSPEISTLDHLIVSILTIEMISNRCQFKVEAHCVGTVVSSLTTTNFHVFLACMSTKIQIGIKLR